MQLISFVVRLAPLVFIALLACVRLCAQALLPACARGGALLAASLYLSSQAYATDVSPPPAPKAQAATAAKTAPPVPAEKTVPHIALLLPLQSSSFGRAADAVRLGFLTAAGHQLQALPVRVYASNDEAADIIALYQQAIANGASAVVGPLTRKGVTMLAAYSGIGVPTLALNVAESKDSDKLYFFGLTAEMEAHQIAQIASASGLRNANIVSSGTPLAKRLSQAFAEEWKILGNKVSKEVVYQDDSSVLAGLVSTESSMVFLAADADVAYLIRPYLNNALPVYATSQIFNGNTDTLTNFDLNDIHFIDMPWLLQPDHPAVMIYPRASTPLEPDMERFYALGIDAFRLIQIMLDNSYRTSLPLDGVTGRIHLSAHRQFQREGVQAKFWQGRGLTPEGIAAQEAALAAGSAGGASGVPAASSPVPVTAQ